LNPHLHEDLLRKKIAFGDSGSGLVEGYCTVQEIMKILFLRFPDAKI